MSKLLRPGQLAPESGIFAVVSRRGTREIVAKRGAPLPPLRRFERGYRLRELARHL